MSRRLTLALLSLHIITSLFAQSGNDNERERFIFSADFWQSKEGGRYLRKKAYRDNITLHIRFKRYLTDSQKQLLEVYGCKLIGYQGDRTYLAHIPTNELINIQALPFVEKITDFDIAAKSSPDFGKIIPPDAIQNANDVWIEALTIPQITREEIEKKSSNVAQLIDYYPEFNLARIKIAKRNLHKLLNETWLIWADYATTEELTNQFGVTTTRTGSLQFHLPQLTGKGVNVGVWDGSAWLGPHVDFVNRTSPEEPLMGESFTWRQHATHVSGTLASAGLRYIYGRGIAPEAKLFNYNIVSTGTAEGYIPFKMLKAAEQHGIVITQNSYGPAHTCSAGGIPYSATNRSQDLVANAFPELLHVFSAGNSGGACGGYRNTVNGAKNIISVASLNANDQRMWLGSMQSSAGPTRDGRLQPHIAAPGVEIFSTTIDHFYASGGWSGTSMASPHVSGIAALLYQHYRELNGGQTPSAALVRAVLLNGANDLGNPGPDYVFGYGKVNAVNAANAITQNRFLINAVAHSQTNTHHITVPAGSRQLKIMLSWNDPAALPSASPALVNDLNLQAKSPSGTIVLPLVLNPANPAALATQGVDNLNNNEQITVELPEAGNWEIMVTGATIAMGNEQEYALTWQVEGEFLALRNPTTTERDISTVHWDSRAISGNVTIEFFDGATWTTLGTAPASQGRFNWTPPAIVTDNARIRISATGESGALHSETSPPLLFIGTPNITPNPNTTPYTPGNNSLTFSWTAAAGAEAYEILWLNLQKGAWEVIATVPSSTTTYTVTGLENGVRHWLTVRTRNNTLNASGNPAYAGFGTPVGVGAAQDLAITAVAHQIPAGGCFAPMQPQEVKITLQNKGINPIPAGTVIPVAYRIDEGVWISENFTLPAELAINQTVDYTFAQTFTPAAAAELRIEARCQWADDAIFTNDSRLISISVPDFPVATVSATPALAACTVPVMVNINGIPDDDYLLQNIAFQPEDMSAATEISMGDDGASGAVPIGFPFKFYNNTFEKVYISAEGFLTFRNVDFDFINFLQRAIPNTLIINDFIALAWKNMRFVAGSKIRYQTIGTAPQRKFVVEFLDMAQENDHSKRLSGQIMLYESLNRIELHITRLDASPLSSVIAGIENREGTAGVALPGMNNTPLASDIIAQAWAFVPFANGFQWLDNSSNLTARLFTAAGTYRFRYEHNGCAIEQDVVVCNDVPDIAPVADVTTPEDVPVSVPILITYGSQPETLLTILQSSDNPALIPDANLIWTGTGTDRQLQITPLPNQFGAAQITIIATDGVQTATRTFQVTVTPVNDPPVVNHFTVHLFENADYLFTTANFINHYSDIENDPLTSIKILTLPANGQLLLNGAPIAAGAIITAAQIPLLRYRPQLNFLGTDAFQWTASDGTDFAALPAIVSLRVSKRPEPALPIPTIEPIGDVTTYEDTPVTVPVRIGYGNLSDEQLNIWIYADDNVLLPRDAFRWIGANNSRSLIITPAANRFGETRVTLSVSNGKNGATVRFNVRVLPVNDAPTIRAQQIRVKSGRQFAFSPLFFDSVYADIENDPLAAIQISQPPQNGRLLLGDSALATVPAKIPYNKLNLLIYKPFKGFAGEDIFTWQASDGMDWSKSATVAVQVWNTPPQVSDWQKRIHWRDTLRLTYEDWQAIFTDPDSDLPTAITIWGNTFEHWRYNGRPVVSGVPLPLHDDARFTFHANSLGAYRFFWNASDGTSKAERHAEINILVGNTPPVARSFAREGIGEVKLAANHFDDAYDDVDGDPMARVRIAILPKFGQLFWQDVAITESIELMPAQLDQLIYRPFRADELQPDSIGWRASDGAEFSNLAFARLHVTPLALPQVRGFEKEVFENQTLSFRAEDFLTRYAYGDRAPDFIRITQLPFYGTLRIGEEPVVADKHYSLEAIARMTYRPRIDFVGQDGFWFTAGTDSVTASQAALVNIRVLLQPIDAPQNLRIAGNRIAWKRPAQGNVRMYELQVRIAGKETLAVYTFLAEEHFTMPTDLANQNFEVRVRAWGYHNNAGPFTEWFSRPQEIVANAPEIIFAPRTLQVYPNPAAERIFLRWERMPDAHFRMIDASGRIIAEWYVTTASGTQTIDLQGLSAGIYRIQTICEGQRYVCAFVVMK